MKGFSSKKIKSAIWECMPRVLIDKMKVNEDTFEPVEMRGDYYITCFHVAEVNVVPFTKNLTSQLKELIERLAVIFPASRSDQQS